MHPHSHWYACVTCTHTLTHSLTHSHSQRLPPGYRDLIEFFSRYPGLVKWTGVPLLLYFNTGSLDALGCDHHVSVVGESDTDHDDTVDRGGQTDETNAGSLDALGSDHHASAVGESDGDRDDAVDRGGQPDETKRRCTVM